ncbi:MFS transporter [Streptomyces sp. NPDC008313]|uniref:MFS transporter n=1 Tax=Streptomyces sp. NPDC008313 TaxID=3364826 RepID=UPI0036ED0369
MTGAAAHRRVTLASSVVGAVIVALDGTVLAITQPTLQRDLHAGFAQVQWTSTGYLIAVASLLVFAGRLGDRYGHQRIFAIGILGFGAASAGIGLAPDVGWVVGLRVVQGVFGALLQPATLGMLRAAYPPDRLGMPIALRTSAIGLAAAAGPLVGGVLVSQLGWRAVFFLNVVPALAMGVLALAVRRRPERGDAPVAPPRAPGAAPLDLPGACLLATALVFLVHTLVGIPEDGWTAGTVLGLVATAVTATAFARHERRAASPLVPAAVLGSAAVGSALTVLVVASAAMMGTLFAGTYLLQDVIGLDALGTGLRALPGPVAMVPAAPAAAVLLRRQGPRRTTLGGIVLLAAGVLILSRLGPASADASIGGGFLLLGAGFGTVMVTATAVVVRQAPAEAAGVAGGLQQTAMNVGPVLGVAAATTLMSSGSGVATGPALTVLAALAAAGALPAARLPGRRATGADGGGRAPAAGGSGARTAS